MKEEKYFCDKCKKEVTHERDTCINVRIELRFPDRYYSSYRHESVKSLELCWDCAKNIGLKKIEPEEVKQTPPDIADKLYDILCDLGVQFES